MAGFLGTKPPTPKPVTPMPVPDGAEAMAAKRKQMEMARMRSGRASTLLSGDYSESKLGTR